MSEKKIELKKYSLEKCIQKITEAKEPELQIAEDTSEDENEP